MLDSIVDFGKIIMMKKENIKLDFNLNPFCKGLRPFVKWAGGKTQILPEIRKVYPEGLGIKITKYCEPFVGGGAVLFDVLSKYKFEEVYISDINEELIETYKSIRDNVEAVIGHLKKWQDEYRSLDENGRKTVFPPICMAKP